jgi:superfamily II DNA or RNA helicase
LLPRKRALLPFERDRVAAIPGAFVDHETGEVTGQDHALWAVAKVHGAEGKVPAAPLLDTNEPVHKLLAPFQRDGAKFLADHAEDGALCHDDMGLGKTVQAIRAATMAKWHKHAKLVLCPAFLRPQWEGEIKRWGLEFTGFEVPVLVLEAGGTIRGQKGLRSVDARCPPGGWVVAYYHDAEAAMDLAVGSDQPYLLIFDEAHNLRGYRTQRTEETGGASTFAAGRIALTGDLLVNNAAKLHPVLNLIQPGAFGPYKKFSARYASGGENEEGYWTVGALRNEDELRERMRFFSFRRTWDDIPAKERPFDTRMQTVWVDVEKGHRALRSLLVKGVQLMAYAQALADAKMEVVLNALRNDTSAGIPSLTFTLTKKHASELVEGLRDKHTNPLLIHSEVADAKKRLPLIESYVKLERVNRRVPLVISTLGSLREGANLQWAKCVNFAALPYAPDEVRQGLARAARMGQEGTVIVRFFVAKGTGDQYFVELMKRKLKEQLALAGNKESAKVSLDAALSFTQKDIDEVLARMMERARDEE